MLLASTQAFHAGQGELQSFEALSCSSGAGGCICQGSPASKRLRLFCSGKACCHSMSQLQTIPFNKNVRLMRLGFAQMAVELVASRK